MRWIGFLFVFSFLQLSAQEKDESYDLSWSSVLPNISANHPIGIFISRSEVNFGARPSNKTFRFQYNMGNVWLPKVDAYFPTNLVDRAYSEQYVWHYRGREFWQDPDSISFEADGVVRTYQIAYKLPLNEKQWFAVNAVVYSLDGGEFPYSMLSSDGFIEWFHSNVAGGEDPFARKDYAYDQALIRYQDREGNQLELEKGDVGLAKISLQYYHQFISPWLAKHRIDFQGSALLGVNTSSFNRSINLGIALVGTKDIRLGKSSLFRIGASAETTRLNGFQLETNVELNDVSWISQLSFFMGWEKALKSQRFFSISTLHQVQTSYFNPQGADLYALYGDSDVSHWHYAVSHLYQRTYGNSLILAYGTKTVTYNVYLRQDLIEVDNAPDIQTGIGLSYKL